MHFLRVAAWHADCIFGVQAEELSVWQKISRYGGIMNHRLAEFANSKEYSLQGCLLVANPNWDDERFAKAVMLVVHHEDGKAIGIALNKDFQEVPSAVWQQLLGTNSHATPVRIGGPQSGPVVALHDCEDLAEFSTAEGVHLAAHVDHLRQLVQRENAAVRLIVGQSEWHEGELEAQVAEGLWLPISASRDIVFEDGYAMWVSGLRNAGNAFVCGITGALQPPELRAN